MGKVSPQFRGLGGLTSVAATDPPGTLLFPLEVPSGAKRFSVLALALDDVGGGLPWLVTCDLLPDKDMGAIGDGSVFEFGKDLNFPLRRDGTVDVIVTTYDVTNSQFDSAHVSMSFKFFF